MVYLTFEEVADRFSSERGRKPSARSVRRWATDGVRAGRQTVVLPTVRIPQGLRVTEQGLAEFMRKLNPNCRTAEVHIHAAKSEQAATLDRITG